MSHKIHLSSDPRRSLKQTAKEGLLSDMSDLGSRSEPFIPIIPSPRIVTERPFPHVGAKVCLALTPHQLPGYPLYTNSPILLPRKWHQIYVRREKEKDWYWVHVPDVMTVEGLVDAISVGDARLAILHVGNGTETETETIIEDELRDVPLSRIRSRLGIVEQEGDLRFALYQDLVE
ncbi:hypothetical protein AC578_6941 [Pseudocercospora eumusae]|uniref:Uncharacterized protein n=1 Tax=Pseudocercospora eumusae TaxID=321146 RepID=A0A139H9F1_9PEZI|nr:hypothetical protein AC578_6941 [Pseudocercospora eumusae]